MTKMEKYEFAWHYYLSCCKKHGIHHPIDFIQFVQTLTSDQMETMLEHVSHK